MATHHFHFTRFHSLSSSLLFRCHVLPRIAGEMRLPHQVMRGLEFLFPFLDYSLSLSLALSLSHSLVGYFLDNFTVVCPAKNTYKHKHAPQHIEREVMTIIFLVGPHTHTRRLEMGRESSEKDRKRKKGKQCRKYIYCIYIPYWQTTS